MASIGLGAAALAQYQSNAISSPYTSPARAGKTAPLDVRATRPDLQQQQVSKAGDTLKVSGTSATRAEVQSANQFSQTVQAGLTTAAVVGGSLQKTSDVLGQMAKIATNVTNPIIPEATKENLRQDFLELAGQLDSLAEGETFAGHKVLDGRFKVSFNLGDNQNAIIDVTLPNGKGFDTSGLGLGGVANAMADSTGATVAKALPAGSQKGFEVASNAVRQVQAGIGQAAQSMLSNLTGPNAPFGAPVAGAAQMASNLVAAARASVLANPAAALGAQANSPASAVGRLMS